MKIVTWSLIVGLVFLCGCASIVKKPDIDKVKMVAILSYVANSRVQREGKDQYTNDWDRDMKYKVAETSYEKFGNMLSKLHWKVTPLETLRGNSDYQSMYKYEPASDQLGLDKNSFLGKAANAVTDVAMKLMLSQYFHPKDMYPVELKKEDPMGSRTSKGPKVSVNFFPPLPSEQKKAEQRGIAFSGLQMTDKYKEKTDYLGETAKKLGVDAVLLVETRYCYRDGLLSLGGNGQAFILAETKVKGVDKSGTVVVNMGEFEGCGKNPQISDEGVGMVLGELLFASLAKDRFEQVFREATTKAQTQAINEIHEAIMKK